MPAKAAHQRKELDRSNKILVSSLIEAGRIDEVTLQVHYEERLLIRKSPGARNS